MFCESLQFTGSRCEKFKREKFSQNSCKVKRDLCASDELYMSLIFLLLLLGFLGTFGSSILCLHATSVVTELISLITALMNDNTVLTVQNNAKAC